VKSCRILLAGFLSASCLAAANAHASIITVTNTNDSGPGSLRQAMAEANDGDIIDATGVSGSIELSSGELLVNKGVTIKGPHAEKLSVENTRSDRVFEIVSGKVVTISGLAINSGRAVVGGGIYNAGKLEVMQCSISGNEAGGSRENGLGGGIYNDYGATLTVISCAISGNGADQGGAIYNGGTLDIANSTITGNRATGSLQSSGIGGSVFNRGTLAITNSTISGNLADGNIAFPGAGGGIANDSGTVVIQNSTITGNTADGPTGLGFGGNIFVGKGILEIGNTILNSGSGANIFNLGNQGTIVSDGYNLSSDNGAGYLIAAGDQINTDPRLGPLQNNGGATSTHALLNDSPAINAGNPNVDLHNLQQPLGYDQRGPGFDRVKNGRSDIGAFETQTAPARPTPPPPPTPTPTTPPPSPTPSPSPPPPTPSPTPDPRNVALAKIRREMRFTRTALHQLEGATSIPPSVFAWLKVRLRVLKARLAYPLDDALAQIDRRVLNDGPMSEASKRKLLARLNARLDALRSAR
jgi:hypothetical protein